MRFIDWKIASALPVNQRLPTRCCAGTGVMYSPRKPNMRHVWLMCRSSECDLYWVSTHNR